MNFSRFTKKMVISLQIFDKVQSICLEISNSIHNIKQNYYNRLSSKLRNPNTSSKAYWSILKSFFLERKILVIPPFFVNNKFISDFKVNFELFNDFFLNNVLS